MADPIPVSKGSFNDRARTALADQQLRVNLRKAMDGLMSKRAAVLPKDEFTRLRRLGATVRMNALAKLPDLLERLEQRLTENGITVHWARTTDEANRIVHGILSDNDAKTVVKGKSMATEEMHLNAYLEDHGVEILESDLGEYIIQLADEAPSHIIMPAIHKNTDQIARLFTDKIGTEYTEDVDALTAIARRVLREKFANADAGISGVNFAVAETGTLCLVENEGNGRMSTTSPPLHIAVMGLEKVVENLSDVPPLLSLLTRSATGQPITTYFNMISSPRKDGEKDGPRQMHLVLLDNGRTRIFADEALRKTLQCIRCGACMNHCPVYTRVGGHAYGGVYPGPIGKILTPQIDGMEECGDLATASSLCNACVEVCPVEIPIAQILVRLRNEAKGKGEGHGPEASVREAGARKSRMEDLIWTAWKTMYADGGNYSVLSRMAAKTAGLAPAGAPVMRNWTSVRAKPVPEGRTLHQMAKERGIPGE